MERVQRAAIAFALAALTLAVFIQVRNHEFVDFDDYLIISVNPNLRVSSPAEALRVAFGTITVANWTPLTVLSLQLDHALYGDAAPGYLLTNVGLHIAATLALFFALVALTGATWRSAFVAAVFAIHPLHVESVAWASERRDVLSGLCFALTLAAYARHAARPSPGRYALVALCFGLGLLAKPMLVTVPCVLLLLDFWPLRRLDRRAWLEKLPLLALVAAVSLVTYAVQHGAGTTTYGADISLGQRVQNAIHSYAMYLRTTFWPTPLSPFYPHPRGTLSEATVSLEAAGLLALTAGAFAARRSRPYLLVGWLWFLGMLVPVIGLVQVGMQARADRYTYLPMIGLAIATAWGVADLAKRPGARRLAAAAGGVAIAGLAITAWAQVGFWRDSVTLFEHVLRVEPDAYYGHRRLATLRLREGRLEEAEFHYRRAHEIDPENARAAYVRFQTGMAQHLENEGDRRGALERLHRALEIDPDSALAHGRLGLALVRWHRPLEARKHLEIALRAVGDAAPLHAALASVAEAEGRMDEAIAHNRAALHLDPGLRSARNNLAWQLATAADPALRAPEEALALAEALRSEREEASANLLDTLAAAYAAAGRFEEAVIAAEAALARAEADGSRGLAASIRTRLALYEARRPFLEPPRG